MSSPFNIMLSLLQNNVSWSVDKLVGTRGSITDIFSRRAIKKKIVISLKEKLQTNQVFIKSTFRKSSRH